MTVCSSGCSEDQECNICFLVLWQDNNAQTPTTTRKAKDANSDTAKDGLAYSCLLKNELLSAGIEDLKVSGLMGIV